MDQLELPSLLRIKANTLYKLGKYLRRSSFNRVALYYGEGIQELVGQTVDISLDSSEIKVVRTEVVSGNDIEQVVSTAFALPSRADAIVAVGGGLAVDVAKYAGFLTRKPVIAVPTALSNDGFCSPGASLKVAGRRVSCPAAIPFGMSSRTCPPVPIIRGTTTACLAGSVSNASVTATAMVGSSSST